MISKTKIERKLEKKENPRLVRLIILLKKQKKSFWITVANLLASPKRKSAAVNIEKISRLTKPNDKVIIPGKLLSEGELEHNITIASFNASEKAKEKLKDKIVTIEEMLRKNPEGKNIKIII